MDNTKQVKKTGWGLPGVFLFEFTNSKGMSVAVSNYGAAVVSCLVADRNGKFADVVLGYDRLEEYQNDRFYIGTVVGRYANRIGEAQVNIDGKECKLTATAGGFHHHGGKVGFNKKLFTHELMEAPGKRGVKLTYISEDGEEGFPGTLQLTVTYMLHDDNSLSVEYEAQTDKPTILNPTQHSYFNLAGHDSGSVEKQKIQLPASHYLVVDDVFIPTGELRSVEGTVFDLRKRVVIGDNIGAAALSPGMGYDNSWVVKNSSDNDLRLAAVAEDDASGRVLSVYTTEPSVHFYSANFIEDGTPGKAGALYNRRSGFCLETQHFPDSPHHSHFPSTVLRPEDRFYSKTVFNFAANPAPAVVSGE